MIEDKIEHLTERAEWLAGTVTADSSADGFDIGTMLCGE